LKQCSSRHQLHFPLLDVFQVDFLPRARITAYAYCVEPARGETIHVHLSDILLVRAISNFDTFYYVPNSIKVASPQCMLGDELYSVDVDCWKVCIAGKYALGVAGWLDGWTWMDGITDGLLLKSPNYNASQSNPSKLT